MRVLATGRATYPDVTVVCGKLEDEEGDPDAVTNPSVIVEVLSDTTESDGAHAELPSLDVSLAVDDVYANPLGT